jgi:uncharacterized protein YkwD
MGPLGTLALVALVSACGGGGSSSEPVTGVPIQPQPITSNMDRLINDVRSDNGLPALRRNTQLNAAARSHASDMSRQNFFSHTSSNGDTLRERVSDAGYTYRCAAENLAWGQTSESAALDGWLKSPGHRRNIMDGRYKEYGFVRLSDPDGSHNPLWVMVFADKTCAPG